LTSIPTDSLGPIYFRKAGEIFKWIESFQNVATYRATIDIRRKTSEGRDSRGGPFPLFCFFFAESAAMLLI
jgi:hypothetical protein